MYFLLRYHEYITLITIFFILLFISHEWSYIPKLTLLRAVWIGDKEKSKHEYIEYQYQYSILLSNSLEDLKKKSKHTNKI